MPQTHIAPTHSLHRNVIVPSTCDTRAATTLPSLPFVDPSRWYSLEPVSARSRDRAPAARAGIPYSPYVPYKPTKTTMLACGTSYMPGQALGGPTVLPTPRGMRRPRVAKQATTNLLAELPATHAGLLRRRRLLLGWSKPRMFVIKSGYLLCHPGATEGAQPAVVDLDGCTVAELDDSTRRRERRRTARQAQRHGYAFTLVSPAGRVIMRLKAASPEDRIEWAARLSGVRRRHLSDFRTVATLGAGAYGMVSLVRETTASVAAAAEAAASSPVESFRSEGASSQSIKSGHSAAGKGRFFALKQIALVGEGDRSATSLRRAAEERAVLQRVGGHPFITQLHYAFMEGGRLHYVQGLGSGGDLYDNLRAQPSRRFSESVVRLLAAELTLAIEHLHKLNVLHRDIKPENVLLTGDGHVMLCDFGLAKTLPNRAARTRSFVGTERYCPPEMYMDIGHGRAVDWWQLGCLMYELLVGRPPFYSRNKDRQRGAILSAKVTFPDNVDLSDEVKALITSLLARQTWERLGSGDADADEVKRHAFFQGLDWEAVYARRVAPEYIPPKSAAFVAQLNAKDAEAKQGGATAAAGKKSGPNSAPSKLQQCLQDEFIGFNYVADDAALDDDADAGLTLLDSDSEDEPSSCGGIVALTSAPLPAVTGGAGAGAGAGAAPAAGTPAHASAPGAKSPAHATSLPERSAAVAKDAPADVPCLESDGYSSDAVSIASVAA